MPSLALRLQAVGDQREIGDAGDAILRQGAAVAQQSADQGGFAVVDGAQGDEA